ncbi:MAG: transglycosylase domain-containing protein [Deltaproteobacteria bacterium]|nr:transglycosylase domain-containing protein [Deltaproteobacteria bacterium]
MFLIIAVAVPAILFGTLYVMVTRDAANRIQKGIILQVINSESPVYYDDGKTPIGVFFEKTHRRYVPYREIPKVFVKALVAAEDKNFFHHHGVDFKAIVRALLVNLKAGKVVQGGSTLTQQTAKNIFKRQKRSLMAKLKELIQAFLLERTYSKEEILEMYINQFFVAGFGKGLGIAAKYFFDKEVRTCQTAQRLCAQEYAEATLYHSRAIRTGKGRTSAFSKRKNQL